MRDATLCFLVRGEPIIEILLGFKKAGFGAGKYNGFGGKVESNETIARAAVRELEEETGIRVPEQALQEAAHLTFLFPANPAWDQVVHVFLVKTWDGEPVESAEMKPTWYKLIQIPFENMWQDDAYWLPYVLAGIKIKATFTYQADNETVGKAEIQTI